MNLKEKLQALVDGNGPTSIVTMSSTLYCELCGDVTLKSDPLNNGNGYNVPVKDLKKLLATKDLEQRLTAIKKGQAKAQADSNKKDNE